jgi:hypothetical protein
MAVLRMRPRSIPDGRDRGYVPVRHDRIAHEWSGADMCIRPIPAAKATAGIIRAIGKYTIRVDPSNSTFARSFEVGRDASDEFDSLERHATMPKSVGSTALVTPGIRSPRDIEAGGHRPPSVHPSTNPELPCLRQDALTARSDD